MGRVVINYFNSTKFGSEIVCQTLFYLDGKRAIAFPYKTLQTASN